MQPRLDAPARAFERLLKAGRRCACAKAATFCGNVLELLPAVWRFVVTDGVEPTNNHAERVLRRGVLWRKNAFGSQSEGGCRFVERMLTVVQTRRLQGRSFLDYLEEALVAHRAGLPPLHCSPPGERLPFQLTAKPAKFTHHLRDLFDIVDDEIKDELQQAYAAAPVIVEEPLLRDALDRYSNLFEDIRYCFEKREGGGNDITDLIRLLKFIRQQITNMPKRYRASQT